MTQISSLDSTKSNASVTEVLTSSTVIANGEGTLALGSESLIIKETLSQTQPSELNSKKGNAKLPKGRKSKHALRKAEAKVQVEAENKKSKGARVPPSETSGGVPDPSPEYLLQSSRPPSRLPSPRRLLVIIDLNGTLLYRPSKKNPSHFIERPHARQFLSYCIDTFVVGFWSSARPQNVKNMLAQLLTKEQRSRCLFIWARDQFGLTKEDYDSRIQCYKRLTRVWADETVQPSHLHTSTGQRWDQSNTVLVDDSLEKARSEPHNLLEIPEFAGVSLEVAEVLPQVHDYLNELCHQADVSSYMREKPFQLDPQYRLPPGETGT